jgi:hypothetical protein
VPWSSHTLFDEVTPKIGVDGAALGPFNGFLQAPVRDALTTSEPDKPLGFESSHGSPQHGAL